MSFLDGMPFLLILFCLLAVTVMVVLYPLTAAVVTGLVWRKSGLQPPWQLGVVLWLLAGAAAAVGFFPFGIPLYESIPAVAGILACGVAGGAILLSSWRTWPYGRSLGICSTLGVCVLAWADLRFRVVVTDQDGNPTPWNGPSALLHLKASAWSDDEFFHGHQPVRGIIYIGLFKWLEHKDGWLLYTGDGSQAVPAEWSAWPAGATQYVHRPVKEPVPDRRALHFFFHFPKGA